METALEALQREWAVRPPTLEQLEAARDEAKASAERATDPRVRHAELEFAAWIEDELARRAN